MSNVLIKTYKQQIYIFQKQNSKNLTKSLDYKNNFSFYEKKMKD